MVHIDAVLQLLEASILLLLLLMMIGEEPVMPGEAVLLMLLHIEESMLQLALLSDSNLLPIL